MFTIRLRRNTKKNAMPIANNRYHRSPKNPILVPTSATIVKCISKYIAKAITKTIISITTNLALYTFLIALRLSLSIDAFSLCFSQILLALFLSTTEIYTHVDNEQVRNAVESNPLSNFS